MLEKTDKEIEQSTVTFGKKSILYIHCKFLNARFECNDIVIFIYSHYPLDLNGKSFDTNQIFLHWDQEGNKNYDVIAFKSCIQIFTVYEEEIDIYVL